MFMPEVHTSRDKGMGDDRCIQKKDCPICKAFTVEQVQQLTTPTNRTRKEKEQKKTIAASPVTSTPTLVDPREVVRVCIVRSS